MKVKTIMVYKRKDKIIEFSCRHCGEKEIKKIDMGYQSKSNCDVDLTVDAVDIAKKNDEILLFTGDGDFYRLADYLEDKVSCSVKIVSYVGKKEISTKRRFAIKLRKLFSRDKIDMININDWKDIIIKRR